MTTLQNVQATHLRLTSIGTYTYGVYKVKLRPEEVPDDVQYMIIDGGAMSVCYLEPFPEDAVPGKVYSLLANLRCGVAHYPEIEAEQLWKDGSTVALAAYILDADARSICNAGSRFLLKGSSPQIYQLRNDEALDRFRTVLRDGRAFFLATEIAGG